MTTQAATLPLTTADERSSLLAWTAAALLAAGLVVAARVGDVPALEFAWATAFLAVAVASDVRQRRIPNLLTLPALGLALLVSPWLGGTSGPIEAFAGAMLGFLILVGPYAIGGMGAGDVKALMALGAWLGPETTIGAAVWALLAGAGLGIVLVALRGELGEYLRRWGRLLVTALTQRRFSYEPPAAGSAAASGIPFAVPLALGLAAQWAGGAPW